MKNEIKYEFIASSKVIRHKLDAKTADILYVLVYKHRYWKDAGKLTSYKGRIGYHVSVDDIREETGFSKDVIQKRIKLLKKEGLIEFARQGLTKPNIYFIDEYKIDKYIEDHKEEYKRWRLSIREIEVVVTPMDALKDEKTTSRKGNSSFLEYDETVTTNNKKTNNKKIKTLTNRINAERVIDMFDCVDELEEKIDTLRDCHDETDKPDCIKDIHKFLCNNVPQLKGFTMSEKDKALIAQIAYDGVPSFKIADKIISNAKAITEGKKKSRFGDLLVGIDKMNEEYELKYG